MVDRRGTAPRATILQGSSAPLCAARALSWFRSTLSCSSGKRFHQISLQGELERPVGYDPTSSAWRAETLPLSYGRVVGRGRIRTSEPRRDGVYGAAALASCIPAHVGCGGPNRTAYLLGMSQASYRCSTPRQLVSAFSPRRCEPRHWRSCESWRKAEVLIPNGCPSIPLRTGARLLPG